jgi:hypothetical protein
MPYKNPDTQKAYLRVWDRTNRKQSRKQWEARNLEAQKAFLETGKIHGTKFCKRCKTELPLNAGYVICPECNVKYNIVPGYIGRDSLGVRLKVATA